MNMKTWFSKVVAIICAIAVVAGTMVVPVEVQASTASEYKFIGPRYIHTVGEEGIYTQTSGETPKRLANISDDVIKSLDGVVFDGLFNLAKGAFFCVGGNTNTVGRFQMQVVTKEEVDYLRYQIVGAADTVKDISMEQLGDNIVGKDVRIKLTFELADVNTTNGTADVTIKISVGNSYRDTITASDSKNVFADNQGVVVSMGNAITIREVPKMADYKIIDANYIRNAVDGVYASESGNKTERFSNVSDDIIKSADGIMFDGIFNLASGAYFCMPGNTNGVGRFQMQIVSISGVNHLRYQIVGGYGKDISMDKLGGDIVGKDTRIRVGISLTDVNTTNGTADVTVQIKVGSTYEDFLVANDLNVVNYTDNSGIVLGLGGAITVKDIKADSEYKTVGTGHIAGVGADGVFANETSWTAKRLTNIADDMITSLDGVMFDAMYNFSANGAFGIGGHLGAGANRLQMQVVTISGVQHFRYQFVNGNLVVNVPIEDLNCAIVGNDVRIKTGFTFSDVKETENTADITLHIKIGDEYENIITVNDYNIKDSFVNTGGIIVGPSGAITLKAVPEDGGDEPSGNTPGGEVPVPEYRDESEFKKIGVRHISGVGADGIYTQQAEAGIQGKRLLNISDDQIHTLEDVMFDGIFHLSKGSVFCMGTTTRVADRFDLRVNNSGNLVYQFANDTSTVVTLTPQQVGQDFEDEDIRIKIGFTFDEVNETAGTAKITVTIKIGEVYVNEMTVNSISIKDTFINSSGVVVCMEGAITIKAVDSGSGEGPDYKDDSEYTQLPIQSFTGQAERVFAGIEAGMRPSTIEQAGTLDGFLVDGIYNLEGRPVIDMGGRFNGLQFQVEEKSGVKYLCYQLVGSGIRKDISEAMAGCDLFGKDVRIKAGFTFSNVNEETGTADVEVQISIGDTYKDIYKIEGYAGATSKLARIVYVDARGEGNSVTIKEVEVQEGGGEEPGPEFKDESEYTLVAVQDFTGDVEYVVTGTEAGMRPSSVATAGTLDGLLIDGIYKFEGSPTLNMGGRQNGLQFQIVENGGVKYLCYQLVGSGIRKDVSAEMAGCEIYGEDVRIKAGFTFSNINEETGAADVEVQISIGDTYKDIYKVTAYPSAELRLGRILFVDARAAESTLTIKEIEVPEKELPPLPADSDYTWINFSDYGITKEHVTEGIETGLRAGAGLYDGYMIEGVFNFKGSATVNFGGKNNGLQINLVDKGGKKFLRYQLVGSGKATDVSAGKLGAEIDGADLAIKVGFSFANVNQEAGTADVTVQIRIGDTYKDAFVVQGYKMENLNRILFIDARGEGNAVIMRKPYMEPVDFREFGFTEDYEKELNIVFKKKAVVAYKAENEDSKEKENAIS